MLNFAAPTPSPAIRISIVEENDTIKKSLAVIIDSAYGYQTMSTYQTWHQLTEHFLKERAQVIIASISEANRRLQLHLEKNIQQFKKLFPETKILVFSVFEEEKDIFPILRAGADGYLVKQTSYADLIEAIKEVHTGGAPLSFSVARKIVNSFHRTTHPYLTSREEEVLRLLAMGKTYSQIAQDLFLSGETIKTHIKNIYTKLNVRSKSEAIRKGIRAEAFPMVF